MKEKASFKEKIVKYSIRTAMAIGAAATCYMGGRFAAETVESDKPNFPGCKYTADQKLAPSTECTIRTVAAEADLSALAILMAGSGIAAGELVIQKIQKNNSQPTLG